MNPILDARRRASAGRSKAQLELGWLLVEVGEHYEAYKWMALALDGGEEGAIDATEFLEATEKVTYDQIREAYFEIGCWCEEGEVVPLNVPAAVRLWDVAAEMGHSDAVQRLKRWR
jgi:TPR repeat protein